MGWLFLPSFLSSASSHDSGRTNLGYPLPSPHCSAAVSSLCLVGLLIVTLIIVVRSAGIFLGPGFDWGEVHAVNASPSSLMALPLVVFGFQARLRGSLLREAPMFRGCMLRGRRGWHDCPAAHAAAPWRVSAAQRSAAHGPPFPPCPPRPQCHTNVINVWQELEPRPSFFRAATRPAMPQQATVDAGQQQADAQAQRPAGQSAAAEQGSGQRRPRSEKLAGMARVVAVAVALTALFYSCVGESDPMGTAGPGCSCLSMRLANRGRHVCRHVL